MSEQQKIRIISDGTAIGTKVFTAAGEDISSGIRSISIGPIEPGGLVAAQIEFVLVDLDVTAINDRVEKHLRVPPPAPMPDIGGLVGGRARA